MHSLELDGIIGAAAPAQRIPQASRSAKIQRARPTFLEFFCGGGFARLGLEPRWSCAFANDISPQKGAAYAANFGAAHLTIGDIGTLDASRLPAAELAWASFPCQDLSLCGNRLGMDRSTRSGAFWGFHDLLQGLSAKNRSPRLVVLENVVGALSSKDGADFDALVQALAEVGYRSGALIINASLFVPQSRPRLFVVGVHAQTRIPPAVFDTDCTAWATPALARAAQRLSQTLTPLIPFAPLRPTTQCLPLEDLLEPEAPPLPKTRQTAILNSLSATGARKLAAATQAAAARTVHGVITIRTRRHHDGVRRPTAEPRFDGLAGCLRTPAGGSSHQILISIDPSGAMKLRRFTPRECARLMGAPDSYILPRAATQAYKVSGDAVSPPVVRFLDEALLTPILRANGFTGV